MQVSIEVSGENLIFGQYMHYVIYFYYGNHSNSSILVHDSDFFTFNWNPIVLPAGLNNIEVVAYDINNNYDKYLKNKEVPNGAFFIFK